MRVYQLRTHNMETNEKTDQTPQSDANPQGAGNDQAMGIIAYLGPLCIVPILVAKDSEFAMYHANQGLILFIVAIALSFIAIVPILGWIISFFGSIAVVVLAILGIINAANMEKKPLPLIGGYQLLK